MGGFNRAEIADSEYCVEWFSWGGAGWRASVENGWVKAVLGDGGRWRTGTGWRAKWMVDVTRDAVFRKMGLIVEQGRSATCWP